MNISDVITKTPSASINIDNISSPTIISNTPEISTGEITQNITNNFNWMKIGRYILIILILAFLGFNIFNALGSATDKASGLFGTLLSTLGIGAVKTVQQTTDVAAEGAKLAVDVAAGTVDDATKLLEKGLGAKGVTFNRIDNKKQSTEVALNNAIIKQQSQSPEPDEAGSLTQKGKASAKSGYCYIGEDRGFRSCIKVNEGDTCMSGDIFPSQDICVNPSLRA